MQQLLRGIYLILLLCASLFMGCSQADSKESASADAGSFKSYWYSGNAEITRYELQQARYGEMRKGDAVLIFVTEDFLADKQVKYEFGDNDNAVPILKMNSTRKFYTGIYPYSMMTSVFTPTSGEPTLKVATSSQEWCGHTFLQLNNRDDKIAVELRSYFQAESDQNFKIDTALLEDELWTKIRINPESLPTGDFEIIPGSTFARLRHTKLKGEKASASLKTTTDKDFSENEIRVYELEYKELERKLSIKFEKEFPYQILGWEETYKSGFGANAKLMTTKAIKTHSLKTNYWSKNKLSDSHLRDELGIIY